VVTDQVLAALQPAALELSLAVAQDVERERERLNRHWQQRLERAHYKAGRAERQFHAVEPENRLVARALERRWEEALQEQRRLEEEHARYRRAQPASLTADERAQIRALAQDLPALWEAPTTTAANRQRIIRFLVELVVITVEGRSDRVMVRIEWVGGTRTTHEVRRTVLSYEQMLDFDCMMTRLRELHAAGMSFGQIAERLNAEGFHPPKKAVQFDGNMVGRILKRRTPGWHPRPKVPRSELGKDEWLVVDLAVALDIPKSTLHAWIRRGWVRTRSLSGCRSPLICWADRDELERLHRLRETPHGWWDAPLPTALTTPEAPTTPCRMRVRGRNKKRT
jgi:hypothetical protein